MWVKIMPGPEGEMKLLEGLEFGTHRDAEALKQQVENVSSGYGYGSAGAESIGGGYGSNATGYGSNGTEMSTEDDGNGTGYGYGNGTENGTNVVDPLAACTDNDVTFWQEKEQEGADHMRSMCKRVSAMDTGTHCEADGAASDCMNVECGTAVCADWVTRTRAAEAEARAKDLENAGGSIELTVVRTPGENYVGLKTRWDVLSHESKRAASQMSKATLPKLDEWVHIAVVIDPLNSITTLVLTAEESSTIRTGPFGLENTAAVPDLWTTVHEQFAFAKGERGFNVSADAWEGRPTEMSLDESATCSPEQPCAALVHNASANAYHMSVDIKTTSGMAGVVLKADDAENYEYIAFDISLVETGAAARHYTVANGVATELAKLDLNTAGLTPGNWFHVHVVVGPEHALVYFDYNHIYLKVTLNRAGMSGGMGVAGSSDATFQNYALNRKGIYPVHHKWRLNDPHDPVLGFVDEFRMFEMAKATETIARNHDSVVGGNEVNLLLYWPMDENTGYDLFDDSKNQLHGALHVDVEAPQPGIYTHSDCPVKLVNKSRSKASRPAGLSALCLEEVSALRSSGPGMVPVTRRTWAVIHLLA
jgi:hypothetical protein